MEKSGTAGKKESSSSRISVSGEERGTGLSVSSFFAVSPAMERDTGEPETSERNRSSLSL
ncbi:MAG: hypothetical protein ACLR1D_04875 [Dialister sp.]